MDITIWENTVVVWLNSICYSHIDSIKEINDSILKEVITKISTNYERSPVEFLRELFQNLTEIESFKFSSDVDFLCASTLLLIYVSLTNAEELEGLKDLMCTKLDTSTQLNIVEFLNHIQKYDDVFDVSFKKFKHELFPEVFLNFKEKHSVQNSMVGDSSSTPVRNDVLNSSVDSPLQGFFQTPKRNVRSHSKSSYRMCGDGDHAKHIKKLTDQLAEEESEKALLQEQLNIQTQKCSEYESKLKVKIEEIRDLKDEWEKESRKNEEDVSTLKCKLSQKMETEKKLKTELGHLESYVSRLELDLSNFGAKNDKLENQLKTALEKITTSEEQLQETSALCLKLQSTIIEKEKELEQFKENYTSFYNDEKAIDVSFMNRSLERSVCSPENLGVVADQLLREKIEENIELQETIEQLKTDKKNLLNEVKLLNEKLSEKSSVVSELQVFKEELNKKIGHLEKNENELFEVQKKLLDANTEITKLNKENFHLTEKYNILNSRLREQEQVLINSNNSKMLLQMNFLKLAENFQIVQQRLEMEVNHISRLALSKVEELSKIEGDSKSELKDFKDVLNRANFSSQSDQNSSTDETVTKYDPLGDEKMAKLAELLQNFESHFEWTVSKASLQRTCSRLNDNILVLKTKLREFGEQHRMSLEEKSKYEKRLKEAEEKIVEIQTSSTSEIKRLTGELDVKENKIQELEKIVFDLKKMQEELLIEKEAVLEKTKMSLEENDRKIINECGDHRSSPRVAPSVGDVNGDGKADSFSDRQEFSDSLEEVPVHTVNKTFDIVNLEEKNSDKTFSIKKEDLEGFSKNLNCESAWVVSPPPKNQPNKPIKETVSNLSGRGFQGESWVVPLGSLKPRGGRIKKVSSSINDLRVRTEDLKISEVQNEIFELTKKCERLKVALLESEEKRAKDKELYEKNQEIIGKNITSKYENQLEHLKSEMKQLYNRELAKHKQEQSSLNAELQDQNKRYKEHIDELRNQLWDLGEKLLQEQTQMRDLKRSFNELKEKYERLMTSKDTDVKILQNEGLTRPKDCSTEDVRTSSLRHMPNMTFTTIPTEDEEEVFDNRFLEDMKTGICKTERAEDRLKELQYRNSLCLPHLKSSYPGETQFHNPTLFKESDLKLGLLQFTLESQSLTDSDHSMTKSLLPDNKGKKKEQTSYKRPGPPTPSKNGGRLSIQSGDLKMTPRNALKEIYDQNERNKGTPNPLKLLTSKGIRRASMGSRDENAAPVTPRKKYFFRKPFGARDH